MMRAFVLYRMSRDTFPFFFLCRCYAVIFSARANDNVSTRREHEEVPCVGKARNILLLIFFLANPMKTHKLALESMKEKW